MAFCKIIHLFFTITFTFSKLYQCSGFLQTSPLLAWSTSPGASLASLLPEEMSELNRPPEQELAFGVTSSSFCPSGSSSLIILTLSSPEHQAALRRGHLSPGITQLYNSAPSQGRLKLTHNPGSEVLRESVLPLLASRWKSSCAGKVIIEQVPPHHNLEEALYHELAKVTGSYAAIFITATSPFRDISSLDRRAFPNISPSADTSKMPNLNTGLLWRYSFFSDYLIIGIFVVVLLLIPPVLLGSYALMAIESPKGLKTKMVGAIAEIKGNN